MWKSLLIVASLTLGLVLLAACQNRNNHNSGSARGARLATPWAQATAPTFAAPPAILPTPATLGTRIADVSLQPGKAIQTAVGFLIPENATGLAFVLDTGSYGDGAVKVALNK